MRNRAGIETRTRILDASRGLLSDGGLERMTIKAICDRAEIRAGSFYNLFDSKDEVILAIVREAIVAVDPDPAGGGTDTVIDLATAYIRFVESQPVLARVYFLVALTGGLTDEKIRARVVRHHQERLNRFTAAHLRDRSDLSAGSAEQRMEALLAALNGYALQKLIDPDFDLSGHVRTMLSLEAEFRG